MGDTTQAQAPFLVGEFPPALGESSQPQQSPGWNCNSIGDWEGRPVSESTEQRPSSASDFRSRLNRSHAILQAYLFGQLANVGKAALWWSSFGILAVSMLRSDIALAATRGSFNLALLVSSPLAVATAESISIRRLLIGTTIGRFLVWSALIPGVWVLFGNYLNWSTSLWISTITFMFFDGLQVAFSNAVDIDCGGLDSLAVAYDLPLTDFMRYRYTSIHQLVFDSSFIFFTPPVVLLFVAISLKDWLPPNLGLPARIVGPDRSIFVLAWGVAIVFGFLSLVSLHYYWRGIPHKTRPPQPSPRTGAATWPNYPSPASVDDQSLWEKYRTKIGEVADGLIVVLEDKVLKWRLILLATETALEDTMVSVIIPMIALNAVPHLSRTDDRCIAALVSVVIIAVGKLGGVIAGVYLASRWVHPHADRANSKRLFRLVALSSLSLILLPWGFWVASRIHPIVHPDPLFPFIYDGLETIVTDAPTLSLPSTLGAWIVSPPPIFGCLAVLLGVFLFFVFSTAPKIGFASLIQNAVSQDEVEAAKVFGFVGMFVTITDGLMIVGINLIFSYLGRERFLTALSAVVAIYGIHGLLEWWQGVRLAHEEESA